MLAAEDDERQEAKALMGSTTGSHAEAKLFNVLFNKEERSLGLVISSAFFFFLGSAYYSTETETRKQDSGTEAFWNQVVRALSDGRRVLTPSLDTSCSIEHGISMSLSTSKTLNSVLCGWKILRTS